MKLSARLGAAPPPAAKLAKPGVPKRGPTGKLLKVEPRPAPVGPSPAIEAMDARALLAGARELLTELTRSAKA
jgi:hypothetical protein